MENYDTPPVPEDNAEVPETPVSPTPQKRDELAEQKKRCDDLNDRYLRLAADFDNYRKRTSRDHESLVQHANERFAVDILEIADNMERALKADDDHLRTGVEQIRQLLAGILARNGITPIDALKKSFDPGEHEAVAHVSSDETEGTVVDVLSPGYRMHKKVIRYAKVAVSKGHTSNDEATVEK
ncbi:MAG: nucleotide exchange factor GrpE [Methanoregula sp.]|uniref:nucleotide exchange factor GrpE n=1 Tax=Methanoregula sp. TaxID=2052170 RepID=UPI003C56350D